MTSLQPTKVGGFLTFKELPSRGKTKIFELYSKHSGDYLGQVKWERGWRRYVFHPLYGTIWSVECLAQCYKFMQRLMEERKAPIPPTSQDAGILGGKS